MKKTTLAVGTLLAALSAATIVPAAYADDDTTTPAASADACKGCAAAPCKACKPACTGDSGS